MRPLLLATLLLTLAPSAQAQSKLDPARERAAILARARADTAGALEALTKHLARADLPPLARRRARTSRGEVLRLGGRRAEAERVWRQLQQEGVDVGAQLLALANVELTLRPLSAPFEPGQRARFELSGKRTGPVALRLYRLDVVRWRESLRRDPKRGLFAHLRAPRPGALTKVARWSLKPFGASGRTEVETPVPLEAGIYLLTVSTRGVVLPFPLLVSRAGAVVRRGTGPGVIFLAERKTGAPLTGVTVTGLGPDALEQRPLGVTPSQGAERGLLRFRGDLPYAAAWWGNELLVVPLLPASPPPPPPGLAATFDLPQARAGRLVRVALRGLRPESKLEVREPGGWVVQRLGLEPGRRGDATALLALPRSARPGGWRLELGGRTAAFDVAPPLSPDVVLTARMTRGGGGVRCDLRGRLRNGLPLQGHTVSWRLRWLPAEHVWRPTGRRPLPPHALRRTDDPGRVLALGEAQLDANGAAIVLRPLPPALGAGLWRFEAALDDGPLRASAWAEQVTTPQSLALFVHLDRRLAAPRQIVNVTITASDPAGHPVQRRDLIVRVRDAAGNDLERRALRTRKRGQATTSLMFDRSGRHGIEVATVKGEVTARADLWLSDATSALRPRAPLLLLQPDEAAGQLRALGLLPASDGAALRTREGATVEAATVVSLRGGATRWTPPPIAPPGRRFSLTALRDGFVHHAEAGWAGRREPLTVELDASAFAAPGATVGVGVRTGGPNGPRPARVTLSLHDAASARLLARRPRSSAAPPRLVRSSVGRSWGVWPVDSAVSAATTALGERSDPASGLDLRTLAGAEGVTDRRGVASIPLRLPADGSQRTWLRARAVDAQGRVGESWAPIRLEAPLGVRLHGPEFLVEGDTSRLVVDLSAAGYPRDAVLLVRWRARGARLATPQIEGAKVIHTGDPGPNALRLEAARRIRLVFPLRSPTAGLGRITVSLALEGTKRTREGALAFRTWPQGLPELRRLSGTVAAGKSTTVELEVPKGADASGNLLELTVDPETATAVLAGLGDLEARSAGLRGRLEALVVRYRLQALLAKRRLKPKRLGPPPSLTAILHALAASRDPVRLWGSATPAFTLALVRLRRAGAPIATSVLRVALDRCAAAHASEVEARAALRLGGRPVPAAPTPLGPAATVRHALAGGRGLDKAQLKTLAGLSTIAARADALGWLVEERLALDLQATLRAGLLASRTGPGWSDPTDAGAALRALIALALREPERPGTKIVASLEGKKIHTDWSGAGLSQWIGPARVVGSRVGNRARLRILLRGPAPVRFSAAVRTRVRRKLPPAERREGWSLERAIVTGRRRRSECAPGDRFQLRLRWTGEPGSEVEVPLPGGCRLLRRPPGSVIRDGILRVDPRGATSLTLELLALLPGEYRLLPARIRSLREPSRRATTAEATLTVTSSPN